MPTIEIDNEVFAMLQARAIPFVDKPNDVIRRLLDQLDQGGAGVGGDQHGSTTIQLDVVPVGRVHGLIERGLVEPGDKVRHFRKRTNEVFEATITEGGCISIEGVAEPFREPSPALRHFTGSQIDGWANWLHVGSQRTLRDLRDNAIDHEARGR
jgi:hypothetical protein